MPLSTDPTRKAEKHVLQNNNQNSLKIQFPASFLKPKSVIRLAVSVSDWENEAFGHLARFCPHPVSRYAST